MSKIIKLHGDSGEKSDPMASLKGLDLTEADFLSYEALWQLTEEKYGPGGEQSGEMALAFKDADAIVAKAREDAARIEQEAYNKGFEKGEQDGLAAGAGKVEQIVAELTDLLKEIRDCRASVYRRYEEDILALVKAMVDRLVSHEISVNPRVSRACLLNAMEFVVENTDVKVHLNGEDFARIKEAGLSDPSLLEGKNRIQLIEDPQISKGGCLLVTEFGEIDATLETSRDKLIQEIDQAFLSALAKEPSIPE